MSQQIISPNVLLIPKAESYLSKVTQKEERLPVLCHVFSSLGVTDISEITGLNKLSPVATPMNLVFHICLDFGSCA